MEKLPGFEVLQLETSEGGLKEVVLRWFTETQASLILHNGNFPAWFQGFTTRKDTEDLLRDKTMGCFLIRLSDKAIGYILSYKGQDRCRHFVVSQNSAGLFIISGDCQTHHSLSELIEHYKFNPIQPFGEYLTSCVSENTPVEVYDVVSFQEKDSGVSVQALRSLWDQKIDGKTDQISDVLPRRIQQQNAQPSIPVLPPKSKSRKLTGTVSVDAMFHSQVVPPLPKRGMPLSHTLSGSLVDITSHPSEVQHTPIHQNRTESLRWSTNPECVDDEISVRRGEDSMASNTVTQYHEEPNHSTGAMYSAVEDIKGSLSTKDPNREEYSNRLITPSTTTSISSTLVNCHTYSLHEPREGMRHHTKTDNLSDRVDFTSNPLYQASNRSEESTAEQGDSMYAEVPHGPTPRQCHSDATYEQIPGQSPAVQSNTYESLEDIKPKQSKSTLGKNNINWRKFLPESKKK